VVQPATTKLLLAKSVNAELCLGRVVVWVALTFPPAALRLSQLLVLTVPQELEQSQHVLVPYKDRQPV
jgi:hypothetical protein